VAFLVTEQSKAGVLKQVLEPKPGISMLPAALVRPKAGSVHWFLTSGAAKQLQDEAMEKSEP
jgi:6-phosphogluconolactonase/glucosamine-6-phosphate isomerase/deaminase